ncbi:hypothetical protein ATPR_1530 [Acetobacter tropicalis NBRC 101654]|uniref:Uncharacterized protein n=1 Tax=Acetobacter tropicalis NBRC 101654 TaxID=749388 RepID=F7VDT1_9PROT|nr:hypothetical protein ATPR_1530 [Acetobacter tropicalis NBRC 101654]
MPRDHTPASRTPTGQQKHYFAPNSRFESVRMAFCRASLF